MLCRPVKACLRFVSVDIIAKCSKHLSKKWFVWGRQLFGQFGVRGGGGGRGGELKCSGSTRRQHVCTTACMCNLLSCSFQELAAQSAVHGVHLALQHSQHSRESTF